MDATTVAQVRRFNRLVAQRVGALNDRFLARDRPIAEARVLWEIGREGSEVRELRSRLELDSGHASRLLRALEADGLVEVVPSAADRRVRRAQLTPAGLDERDVLDRRSDELAASFLAPLSARQRDRLVRAMGEVERLLTAAMVEIRRVDPMDPEAQSCLRRYFAELDRRSEPGLDPSQTLPVEPDEMLVAYLRGDPVGCGALKHHPGAASDIKRMWVSESVRGLGIGRRLLADLEARAAWSGAPAVRLDTNRALTEAIGLYRSSGYVEVAPFNAEPFAHHWFEKRL
jgi:DNA-binding MarR family transcriptional regulator/ribosomal protein S18 acetylase RimI-like enzyme